MNRIFGDARVNFDSQKGKKKATFRGFSHLAEFMLSEMLLRVEFENMALRAKF